MGNRMEMDLLIISMLKWLGKASQRSIVSSSESSGFPAATQFSVAKWRPQSVVAEQFRVAATRLDLLGDRPMGNVVLISSAMKGEGKTSTAANLSIYVGSRPG